MAQFARTVRRVAIGLAAVAVVGFVALQVWARTAPRPSNLGLVHGRLAACPDSPNCVNSQAVDARHAIAPLAFQGDAAATRTALVTVLRGRPDMTLIVDTPDYLYAESRSAVFGFVDDVEFAFDEEAGVVHVRSASRLGHSDLGVNRARIEAIRAALNAAASGP